MIGRWGSVLTMMPTLRSLRARMDRPEVILLAAALAAIALVGWLSGPLVLAIAIGLELTVGGLGAIAILGPARGGLGVARYLTVPLAGVALVLYGRILPTDLILAGVPLLSAPLADFALWAPLAALAVWSLIQVELRHPQHPLSGIGLDLGLVAIQFTMAAGLYDLFGADAWPSPLAILWPISFLIALRWAEARGWGGAPGVGRAALQALGVVQVAAAALLLDLPGSVGPALTALTFYAWGGAADALEAGRPRRELLEFVALGLLGIVVALLLDVR